MADVMIEINEGEVQALLHEVGQTVCFELAQAAADRCGAQADVYDAGSRTIASVYATCGDGYEILEALQ